MSNLSEFVRSRLALRQKPIDKHPDANLLLGFAEQELSAHARAVLLAHLERCAECREILALSTPELATALPELQKRRAAWYVWRWPAAAALTGLVVAAVSVPHWRGSTATVPPAVAEPKVLQPAASQTTAHAVAPPTTPVGPGAAVSVPRKKTLSRPKQKDPPALAQIEQPMLEAPPPVVPQMRFQSLDTAVAARGPEQASLKRLIDASIRQPGLNSIWRIEENGTVSKSRDGKSWTSVRVDSHTRLYALSVNGADVWTGGTDGGLFHSMDDGAHWRRVEVDGASGMHLTDTITKIGSTAQHPLELSTTSGAVWVSFDGRVWRQQ